MKPWTLALLAALATAPLASAQTPTPPACATVDSPLPGPWSAWTRPSPLAAAATPATAGGARLLVGQAALVALRPTPEVTYLLQPEKPGGSVSHGGLAALRIDQPGAYQVGLSSGAWIDLVKDAAAVVSTAHGHGPDCTTLRKVVTFNLQPGDYVLQISANAQASLTAMVVRAP